MKRSMLNGALLAFIIMVGWWFLLPSDNRHARAKQAPVKQGGLTPEQIKDLHRAWSQEVFGDCLIVNNIKVSSATGVVFGDITNRCDRDFAALKVTFSVSYKFGGFLYHSNSIPFGLPKGERQTFFSSLNDGYKDGYQTLDPTPEINLME